MKAFFLVPPVVERLKSSPNPELNNDEKEKIKSLRDMFFRKVGPINLKNCIIISGTGKRHRETCKIMTFREASRESEYVGLPEIIKEKKVIFADGSKDSLKNYINGKRFRKIYSGLLHFLIKTLNEAKNQKKNLFLIGDRFFLFGLGYKKPKYGNFYELKLTKLRKRIKLKHFKL